MHGKRPSLSRPLRVYWSVWQIPVALISTRTSPAFGPSRSSSTISSGFLASKATAARVFISGSLVYTALAGPALFNLHAGILIGDWDTPASKRYTRLYLAQPF